MVAGTNGCNDTRFAGRAGNIGARGNPAGIICTKRVAAQNLVLTFVIQETEGW